MTATYPYSAKNRIANPCSYMYTPFEGEGFFKHFFSTRKNCLIKLENKVFGYQDMATLCKQIFEYGFSQLMIYTESLEPELRSRLKTSFPLTNLNDQSARCIPLRAGDDLKQLSNGGYVYLNQIKPVSDIDTMELLLSLLQAITDEDTAKKTYVKDWLSWLVQKFEVTKRLYTRYPSGLKKGVERYDQIILYALLAFLLANYYGKNRSLNYLNTLLKLNDLICSVLESVSQNQLTYTTAYFSLASEHIYVKELMALKGLNRCISLI